MYVCGSCQVWWQVHWATSLVGKRINQKLEVAWAWWQVAVFWVYFDRGPTGLTVRLNMKCERIEKSLPVAPIEGCAAIHQMGKDGRGTSLERKKTDVSLSHCNVNMVLTPWCLLRKMWCMVWTNLSFSMVFSGWSQQHCGDGLSPSPWVCSQEKLGRGLVSLKTTGRNIQAKTISWYIDLKCCQPVSRGKHERGLQWRKYGWMQTSPWDHGYFTSGRRLLEMT